MRPSITPRALGNAIAVAGAAALLLFLYLLPTLWWLLMHGDINFYLFGCTVAGGAALLGACVGMALGRIGRGRLFVVAALYYALSLPMQQMPLQRWLSAAALLVCVLGWLWGRRYGSRAA